MGLEKLLTGLYGPNFQIDLDQQIARARVERPMSLDFQKLGDGIVRNNMGVGGLAFQAMVAVDDGRVTIHPTGQSFPLRGAAPADVAPARRWMKVVDWEDPARTALELMPGGGP